MTRRESGQATVEFALVLPVFVLLALLLLQFVLVVRAKVLVHEAAREAVRAASLDPGGGSGVAAAQRIVPGAEVRITRTGVGAPVHVVVAHRFVTDLPMVGALVPDPLLRAESEMRAER